MLTIDVAISTHTTEGIKRVLKMLPPPREGVNYVVSWQNHENEKIPEELSLRNDVWVYRMDKIGLSNNRNNSIDKCKGDIVLISDDDLCYEPDFIDKIRTAYERYPEVDLGVFKVLFKNKKNYPEENRRLTLPFPKSYYPSSVEISFRRSSLNGLKFWDKMGLGNEFLGCGEDELFLISAIRRGMNCRFFNETIARHPYETTGDKITPGILRGQGMIIQSVYPFSSFLRILLKSYRLWRKKSVSPAFSFPLLLKGAGFYIFNRKKIPMDCRW